MRPTNMQILRVILAVGLLPPLASPAADDLVTYRVTPQDTDPAIHRFNSPHYVVFDRASPSSSDLLLFLTGTGANPASVSDFLTIAAARGYRSVSLAYNDVPAIVGVCPQDPDQACSAKARQKRIFGDDVTRRIDDASAESIANRLIRLLVTLDRDHPSERWGDYLDRDALRWERIAVGGHSQGAGMAAFIAQRMRVARVILFSSPWDFYGRERQLAPWILDGSGVTPADAWFGAYHQKENTAALIARAYKALRIPDAHIRVLRLEPSRVVGDNPFHLSVVGNGTTPRDGNGSPSYADDWRFLLGSTH
jgi:pimeloyl-ACP methyl ester carboxylesterase